MKAKFKIVLAMCVFLIMSNCIPAYASATTYLNTGAPNFNSSCYNSEMVANYKASVGQCVWYAWGRVYEKLGIKLPAMGNGKDWDDNAIKYGYSVGTEPKANSVAVWNYEKYGHVAFVEAVNGDNIVISEMLGSKVPYPNYDINLAINTYQGFLNYNSNQMSSGKYKNTKPVYIYLTNDDFFDFWGLDNTNINGQYKIWLKEVGYGDCDVNLSLNGTPLCTLTPDNGGLFSYVLDTEQYNDGNYTLEAIIRSTDGREKRILKDISINNGYFFDFWGFEDPNFSGKCKIWWKEVGYGNCNLTLSLNGTQLINMTPDIGGFFSYELDTEQYNDGNYTLEARIQNTDGRQRTMTRDISINNGLFFDFWGFESPNLSGKCKIWWKEVGFGDCNLTLSMNGTPLITINPDIGGFFSYELDTEKYNDGNYTLEAVLRSTSRADRTMYRNITINNGKPPKAELTKIEVTKRPDKSEYSTGENLNTGGMIVSAIYSNGTSKPVTDYSIGTFDSSVAGKKKIYVEYQGFRASFEVNVKEKVMEPEKKPEQNTGQGSEPEVTLQEGQWICNEIGWWYKNQDDSYPVNTWMLINGVWYYFDEAGYMATGWISNGYTWYYLQPSGAMAQGWTLVDGVWYYMDGTGAMTVGWQWDGSSWYYMNESGAMTTGWLFEGNSWYYLQPNGAMSIGWVELYGAWYYMSDSGAMVTGWMFDGDAWYYMLENGAMAKNTWIDNDYVGDNGVWVA